MNQVLPTLLLPLSMLGAATMMLALRQKWRRAIPIVSPVLLGVSCFATAFWVLAAIRPRVVPSVFGADWFAVAGLTLATILAGGVAFAGEKWLSLRLARRRSRTGRSIGALPPSLAFIQVPSRDESFRAVRSLAAKPAQFIALTLLTVTTEELLYRYVILLVCVPAGLEPLGALAIQGVLYSLNHLAFGIPAIVGKLCLGLILGVSTLLASSVIPALVAHFCYQFLVARQFRTASVPRT